MPSIVVINESAGVSDADVRAMLPALETQWSRDLAAAWGVEAATFAFRPRGAAPPDPGAWWVVFVDGSGQAADLGYHDLTNHGLPIAKVFVGALLADHASVSVGASHEICEMAVDPWLNSAYQDPTGTFWAGEVCDPVADDRYGYEIGAVWLSNFVTPAWFGHGGDAAPKAPGPLASVPLLGGRRDWADHADHPFQILSGGFAQRFQAREGWIQVTGPQTGVRGRTAPRGSRRERRARQAVEPLQRSRRCWPGP